MKTTHYTLNIHRNMCRKYYLSVIVMYFMLGKGFTDLICHFDKTLNLDVSSLAIHFYDYKENRTLKIPLIAACEYISELIQDTSRRLVVFIPGYRSIINGQTGDWVREAFKETDAYLLIVDYSPYTDVLNEINYEKAVTYTYYIGKAVGEFLANLNRYGYPSVNILCLGHSFGGPILGYIGETYLKETSEKLGRVTAVELAKPCFEGTENRVRSGIADCVDVFHCTYGDMSVDKTMADVDVLVNVEMETQPGCYDGYYLKALGRVDAETCGHVICFKYWTWTVLHPNSFVACSSIDSYMKDRCRGNCTIVGYHGSCDVHGVVYTSTDTYIGSI